MLEHLRRFLSPEPSPAQLAQHRETREQLERMLGTLERILRPAEPPPAPDPFVCVLVEAVGLVPAHDDDRLGRLVANTLPMFLGASGAVRDALTLTLQSFRPLGPGRVIVFCDLARVRVAGIFRGTDLLSGGDNFDTMTAPVATFDRLEPGVLLRVRCERLEARAHR